MYCLTFFSNLNCLTVNGGDATVKYQGFVYLICCFVLLCICLFCYMDYDLGVYVLPFHKIVRSANYYLSHYNL